MKLGYIVKDTFLRISDRPIFVVYWGSLSNMPSLQLLQLTERGRGLLASRRKALLLATSIVVVGGTVAAAYVQSRNSHKKPNYFGHHNEINDNRDESYQLIGNDKNVKKSRQKKGNLRSLHILATILLSRMGRLGAINVVFGGHSGF